MSEMTVQEFFERFQTAGDALDKPELETQFHDFFIYAQPSGVSLIQRIDFLKALDARKQYFLSLGLTKIEMLKVEPTELNEQYILAKVWFQFHFQKQDGNKISIPLTSSYVLARTQNSYQIIFYLNDYDLGEVVKNNGLGTGT